MGGTFVYTQPMSESDIIQGIDETWPEWDARDEILRRVGQVRTDLNWNEQVELADELTAKVCNRG